MPVLAHIAAELRDAGITRALFIVSDLKLRIRAYFGDVHEGVDHAESRNFRYYTGVSKQG